MHQIFYEHGPGAWGDTVDTLRFKINGGECLFFREFWRPPFAAYFDRPVC